MSDLKTEMFVPEFYLVSKDKKIKLSGEGTIGRSKADILIKDEKLSSLHCKFLVRGTKLFITDLNSTNGVYLNTQKIETGIETGLNLGDKVRVGSNEFVLFDEDQPLPEDEEIRSLSWKEIFSLRNLFTFYGVSIPWKILYIFMILFPLYFLLESSMMAVLTNYDSKISFLNALIDGSVERKIVLCILCGLILAIILGYDSKYRKRGLFLKSLFLCSFFVINFVVAAGISASFIDYDVREYLKERDSILKLKKGTGLRPSPNFSIRFENIKGYLSHKEAQVFIQDYLEILDHAKIKSNIDSNVTSCQLVKDLFTEEADKPTQAQPKILEQLSENKFNCPESLAQYFIDNKGSADEGVSGFLSDIYLLDAPMVLDWVSKDGELQSKLESGLANAFYEKRELSADELSLAFVGKHPEVIKEGHKHFDLAKGLESSVIQSLKEGQIE